MESVTRSVDWQAIYGIAGLFATVLTAVIGPRVVSKAKQRQKSVVHDDMAYLEGLVTQLEQSNIERDKMIEYYRHKMQVNEARYKQQNKRLMDEIERLRSEKELATRHTQVIKQKLSSDVPPATQEV